MLRQHNWAKKSNKRKPNLLKTNGTSAIDARGKQYKSRATVKASGKPNEGQIVEHFKSQKGNGIPIASLKTTASGSKKIRLMSKQESISKHSNSVISEFHCNSSSNLKLSSQGKETVVDHVKSNSPKLNNHHVELNSQKKPKKITPKLENILESKPEEPSPNWNAFLKARAQRRKEGNRTFFKKAKPRNPPKNPKDQSEVWFDDVDEILLDKPIDTGISNTQPSSRGLVKEKSFGGLTRILAMDCEMVGVGFNGRDSIVARVSIVNVFGQFVYDKLTRVLAMDCEMVGVGFNGRDSIVARVSIVNVFGQCVYDKYVAPTERVTDYRTTVSGIRPENLVQGLPFKVVQKEVSDILKDRILVGHAVHHDLKVLFLDHPRNYTRDTSDYKPFRKLIGGGTPSLKRLSEKLLNVRVQEGEHNSVQDAQAAMRLYTMHKKEWEKGLRFKRKKPKKKKRSQIPN